MIEIRKSEDRGHFDHGWLDTYHTFSFADYHDPTHMNFQNLRVINEDVVQPSQGFPTHSHQDMEIITYILEGSLEHKDSMGNTSVIKPGEVQRMSAGTGVTHSEFNPSSDELVHLLQIWITPEKKGIQPGYEQKQFSEEGSYNQLRLVASHDGREGSVTVHQNINLYDGALEQNHELVFELAGGRHAWLQVIHGKVKVNGEMANISDGVAISDEDKVYITAIEKSSILLFDLN
jgi:redox-sensitive bicupin YhaK (pirin superfamily)